MPKNKIEDLRNLLFETMERLMDADDPMDIKQAATVAEVAQVIVNSAKVEVDFIKQTGHGGSSFIQNAGSEPKRIQPISQAALALVGNETHEQLCTRCPLPDCDEASVNCLIQIQKRAA